MKKIGLTAASLIFALNAHAALDVNSLKENVVKRVNKTVAKEKLGKFDESGVDIEAKKEIVLPVAGGTSFYAVKINLESPNQEKDSQITLVVDESGKFQLGDLSTISDGESLIEDDLENLNKVSLPKEYGSPLVQNGTGENSVFLVSDPFCPFCKKAFNFFDQKGVGLNRWNLIHMPLDMHPGADLASFAMLDAEEVGIPPLDAARFAYNELEAPKKGQDPSVVLEQFASAFPELAEAWGPDMERASYYLRGRYEDEIKKDTGKAQELGVSGTPGIFVNGVPVRGFDQQKVKRLLSK